MSTCASPRPEIGVLPGGRPLLSRGAVRRFAPSGVELRCRRDPEPPASPGRTVVRQTVCQTAVHLHQTFPRHIHRHVHTAVLLRRDAVLLLLPREAARAGEVLPDPSRPTRAAHALLRLFSKESAKRELLPFYRDTVRSVLREEQERYKSRPAGAVALIWNLFGRPHAFRTLTRFYLGAVEKLGSRYFPALSGPNALCLAAGVVLHSQVYRRHVRRLWTRERQELSLRYSLGEVPAPDGLMQLPALRSAAPPPREELERPMRSAAPGDARPAPPAPPRGEARLSEEEFRALVRGVARSLGKRARLEALERGGL